MRDCVDPARLLLAAFAVLFLSVRRLTARVGGGLGGWESLSRGGSEEAVARLPPSRGR